jgi:uncharacterized membrane protein
MFTPNMGQTDRIIRVTLAVIFAVLIVTQTVTGIWAILLGIFAVTFVATSLMRSCPLYGPFGISTMGRKR